MHRSIRTRSIAFVAVALLAMASSGVSAQSPDPGVIAPVEVTATSAAGPCVDPTVEVAPGIVRSRGSICHPAWTWSDPRLNGAITLSGNDDRYIDGDVTVGRFAYLIENDEGAWRSRPLTYIEVPGVLSGGPRVWILDGEGAYEGLVAVLDVVDYVPHGFIFTGELPPDPDIASTR